MGLLLDHQQRAPRRAQQPLGSGAQREAPHEARAARAEHDQVGGDRVALRAHLAQHRTVAQARRDLGPALVVQVCRQRLELPVGIEDQLGFDADVRAQQAAQAVERTGVHDVTDRRFNRMRPSIAPRKRHQAG